MSHPFTHRTSGPLAAGWPVRPAALFTLRVPLADVVSRSSVIARLGARPCPLLALGRQLEITWARLTGEGRDGRR